MDIAQKSLVVPEEIKAYLEDIVVQAKIPVQDEASREQVIQDLFLRLDKYIAIKLAEHLTEDQAKQFVAMQQEGKPQEEVDAFITTNIPNADQMFANIFVDFRDFYLSGQSVLQQTGAGENPK